MTDQLTEAATAVRSVPRRRRPASASPTTTPAPSPPTTKPCPSRARPRPRVRPALRPRQGLPARLAASTMAWPIFTRPSSWPKATWFARYARSISNPRFGPLGQLDQGLQAAERGLALARQLGDPFLGADKFQPGWQSWPISGMTCRPAARPLRPLCAWRARAATAPSRPTP